MVELFLLMPLAIFAAIFLIFRVSGEKVSRGELLTIFIISFFPVLNVSLVIYCAWAATKSWRLKILNSGE